VNNKTTKNVIDRIKKLGHNIATRRKELHLTQNQLAEIVDISREHLAKIETAKRSISLDLLIKIADTLDTEVKNLFDF
jgi:transcriptional regulator with XRE-family HTH domain